MESKSLTEKRQMEWQQQPNRMILSAVEWQQQPNRMILSAVEWQQQPGRMMLPPWDDNNS